VLQLISRVRILVEVSRWSTIQALFGFGLVLAVAAFTNRWLYGVDSSGSALGYAAPVFCLAVAAIETFVFAIRNGRMVRELAASRDEFHRLAYVDPLTGLPNRRGFDEAAEESFTRADAQRRPVAVLMCDLDQFKAINDQFGHGYGDAALRHVAKVLRATSAERNVVLGRMGGEEFLMLLPDLTAQDAFAFAESLRLAVAAQPVEWDGVKASITMSIGLAVTPPRTGLVPLIVRADTALHEAKLGGRNCVAVAPATSRPYFSAQEA
jgi:diguanylate cyclase (GGDEF)-like protein